MAFDHHEPPEATFGKLNWQVWNKLPQAVHDDRSQQEDTSPWNYNNCSIINEFNDICVANNTLPIYKSCQNGKSVELYYFSKIKKPRIYTIFKTQNNVLDSATRFPQPKIFIDWFLNVTCSHPQKQRFLGWVILGAWERNAFYCSLI